MARRVKKDCIRIPEAPGTNEDSKLYAELSKLIKNRPLTNFVYASYLQSGVAEKMDSLNYQRNKQNQHKAKDVYEFFDVATMASEVLKGASLSKSVGFTDNSGNLVDFNAEEAYHKAQDFNNTNKGNIAYVVQHGDKFNILIDARNSRTLIKQIDVNKGLVQWGELSAQFNRAGVNINTLVQINPALVNPGSIANFLTNLSMYKFTPNDGFTVKDIRMLLALNPEVPIVKNILSRGWGTEEETAQRMYDTIHDDAASQGTVDLINNVLDTAKQLPKLGLSKIRAEIRATGDEFVANNKDKGIQDTIDKMDEEYGTERDVFVRNSTAIEKYSDAVADAIMSLERQIRNIEREKGTTKKSEDLRALKDRMSEELRHRHYAAGLADFMGTANNYLAQTEQALDNLSSTGTNLECATRIAEVTTQATNLRKAYYDIISAIADSDLVNDFAVSDADRTKLKDFATSVKNIFDRQEKKIKGLQRDALLLLGEEFIGTHNALYGKDIADIINMAEADASYTDYLYSVGRSSNTIISMLGALIRDAQSFRDEQARQYDVEITRLNRVLTKDGKNSSFMYDDKGRIVSEYDWDAFFKEKFKYRRALLKSGIRPNSAQYTVAMDEWERAHTEELVVDKTTGRTERVPLNKLKNNFREGWSKAQNEYYDGMMEIKGRIGTLLPKYAQHQFLAPQKRTSWDQVLKEGLQGKRTFREIARWFLNNASGLTKIRKGDDRFRINGIILSNEDTIAATSDYDNTVLHQIPIFYTNRLDLADLSHDFSSALLGLATTALNYDAMNGIKDIAEMITDYSRTTTPLEVDSSGKPLVDTSTSDETVVASAIRKFAQATNVSSLLDSFVLKHIYGVENKNEGRWAVICTNLIGYTSFKGLAANVLGALTNKYVGVIQTLIRAIGGQYFNLKDWAKAEAILFGQQGMSTFGMLTGAAVGGLAGGGIGLAIGTAIGAAGMTGKIMDILLGEKNSKDTLISEFFDVSQDLYADLGSKRFHSTMFGRLFGSFNPMAMYQRGEYWIHMLNTYAILQHEKVVEYDEKTGKRRLISVYDAIKKGNKIDGVAELRIADNIYKLNGEKIKDMSDPYFTALKRRMRYVNQQCHGSMNKEDKGLAAQWMLGKLVLNFRQWMIEHYSSRFRGLHWDESIRDVDLSNFYTNTRVMLDNKKVRLIDALEMVDNNDGSGEFHYKIKDGVTALNGEPLTDTLLDKMLSSYAEDSGWRRGFKVSAIKTLVDYIKDYKEYQTSAGAYWENLSETQRADVKQVLGEALMLLALTGLSACMGDPDDHKGETAYRMWLYVVKRCLFDEVAATVPGAVVEARTLTNMLIPSTQTMTGLLYPILGLGDIDDTIQTGRYAGWNKYGRNVLKYTVPFYWQIDQLLNIGDESGRFAMFEGQLTR